jgi:outer membrane protein
MMILYVLFLGALSLVPTAGAEAQATSASPQMRQPSMIALPPATGLKFSLRQAEAYALKNNPEILTAQLTAESVQQQIREVRAGFFPQVYGEINAVYAPEGTRLAALNSINNPSIYSRQSDGVMVSQLITDFGRTFDLTQSSRFNADAANDRASAARAVIVLAVDHAYFDLRRAQAVLEVSQDTIKARQFSYDQISALFKNKLKSEIDAGFAMQELEQAQLLSIQANNDYQTAEASLSTIMGFSDTMKFSLQPEPLDLSDPGAPDQLIFEAFSQRPELAALKNDEEAARRFAQGERAAKYPKVSALGYAGINPVFDAKGLDHNYYAAGINVEIPLTTGGKLDARAREAALLDQADLSKIVDLQNSLARDVRQVLLSIDTARQKIDVTTEMIKNSDEALKLAQARYQLGTSSIVELTQAELNDTESKLQATSARYDYQIARSLLKFTIGANP